MAQEYRWNVPLPTDPSVVAVVRAEERVVSRALENGRLVYVRGPRKIGKTTLLIRLAHCLAGQGPASVELESDSRKVLSLQFLDLRNDAAAFREAVDRRLEREFFRFATNECGVTHARASELRRCSSESVVWFWDAVSDLAKGTTSGIAILIDEIEGLLHQRDVGEAFLTALRAIHAGFAAPPKLAVCLVGMLPMAELINSATRTPFNTADEIVLQDFSPLEVESMVGPLQVDVDRAPAIADAIYDFVGGHPHLTQRLFGAMKHEFGENKRELVHGHRRFIEHFVKRDSDFCDPTGNAYMHVPQVFSVESDWPALADALDVHRQMLERFSQRILFDAGSRAQKTLEAVGLAKILFEDDERYLSIRNRVVAQLFDVEWSVARRKVLIYKCDSDCRPLLDSAIVPSDILSKMEKLVVEHLCETPDAKRRKVEIRAGSGREVVKDTLFEFQLSRRAPDERLMLQLFAGVGDLGELLWRRQIRTLRRLSGLGRFALPAILEGGILDGTKIAYVLTRRPDGTLAEDFAIDWFRDHRPVAVQQFKALVEALDELAAEGIVHRNIWPGTIGYEVSKVGEDRQLSLVGFEFAVMLRSLVRGTNRDRRDGVVRERREAMKAAFLAQPIQSHMYAPPERMSLLFLGDKALQPDGPSSDVFSLGMLAISWFVAVPSVDEFSSVLRTQGGSYGYDELRHADFIEHQHERIDEARKQRRIPADLGRLLKDMTAVNPRERLKPDAVVQRLLEHDAVLTRWATGYRPRRKRLVCYSYKDTAREFAKWGLVSSAIDTEDSRAEVHQVLESELKEASLYHTERGFTSYVDEPDERHSKAQWVLEGRTLILFCSLFERRRSGFATGGQAVRHILRIGFPYIKRRAWDQKPLQKVAVSDVELVEQSSRQLDPDLDSQHAQWDEYFSIVQGQVQRPWVEVSLAALEWLVRAQNEELELERFPVAVRGTTPNGNHIFELDKREYQEFIDRDTLRSIVYRSLRVSDPSEYFQQIFDSALAERDVELELFDRSGAGRRRYRAFLRKALTAGIEVETSESLPSLAFVALSSRRLAQDPLRRQSAAVVNLGRDRNLHQQLFEPRTFIRERAPVTTMSSELEEPEGRALEVIERIVNTEPFFALQGPPGTGKTTIVSQCVRELLERDRTLRLLITAQSHAAVDNIALRILPDMREGTTAVRVAADWAFEKDLVHQSLRKFRSDRIAARFCRAIDKRCTEVLDALGGGPVRHEAALRQLRETARSHQSEITERLEEAANLVFSTTAGTGRLSLGRFLVNGRFDLAVVEEASKAWPTEIIQPLLLADRYLLIGDHKQLPAYGTVGIDHLLRECISTHPEEFRVLAAHESAVRNWLSLFKSFFEVPNGKLVPDLNDLPWSSASDADPQAPIDRLDFQFRMRRPIADVVAAAFYDDQLGTGSKIDRRPRPEWLPTEGSPAFVGSVVWIDTGGAGNRFVANPTWYNLGEAELAAKLAGALLGPLDISDDEARRRVAILSPYRRQNEEIVRELKPLILQDPLEIVHTVDSFQGQEAEIVILSLVRTRPPLAASGNLANVLARYGFLTSKERVNVMFSRAREIEIIIGDFHFFRSAPHPSSAGKDENGRAEALFWQKLCDTVLRVGSVVPISALSPEFRGERLLLR
jgi:serine/threonine protein kinase